MRLGSAAPGESFFLCRRLGLLPRPSVDGSVDRVDKGSGKPRKPSRPDDLPPGVLRALNGR